MTTITVPAVVRTIDEAMFADLGVADVQFAAGDNGQVVLTTDAVLDDATVLAIRVRLATATAEAEANMKQALAVRDANSAFIAANDGATDPVIAQVVLLTKQAQQVIEADCRSVLYPPA